MSKDTSGVAQTNTSSDKPPSRTEPAPPPVSSPHLAATEAAAATLTNAAVYACDNGAELKVAYEFGETSLARMALADGPVMSLKMVNDADMPTFSDGKSRLQLEGGRVVLKRAGQPPLACTSQSRGLPPPVPEGVAKTILASEAGTVVTVKTGERFAVALSGVPTAGYVWAVESAPKFVTKTAETGGPTSSAQFEPGFAGGSHWEVFVFSADAAGEATLKLAQRRPWEDRSTPDADTFSVRIKVGG